MLDKLQRIEKEREGDLTPVTILLYRTVVTWGMRILLHIVSNLPNITQCPAFYTSAVYHVKSNKPAPSRSNVEGFNQPVKCARYHIQFPLPSPHQRYNLVSHLDVKDGYTRARNSKIIVFLISNFRRVLNILCFLLGSSPASELYMPTFRNTLSVPSS